MILRRPLRYPAGRAERPSASARQLFPLRRRLAILTALMVAITVAAITGMTYLTVASMLTDSVDESLDGKAESMLERVRQLPDRAALEDEIDRFTSFNPDIRVSISPAGSGESYGALIPAGDSPNPRTVGEERVLTKRGDAGATVVMARDMSDYEQLVSAMAVLLGISAVLGLVAAVAAGFVVSGAGLRPLRKLQTALDRVAKNDDLRPLPVDGDDQLAQLTRSFNEMLAALRESRSQQSQLVADAGHELKTPMASIRTNVELLMMIYRSGDTGRFSDEERELLERDVIAQLEELSDLAGDLVDLAREEPPSEEIAPVRFDEVVKGACTRARRRRVDVEFVTDTIPWVITGDSAALGRVALNLVDNAAKWSPPGGTVRVRLARIGESMAELSVADSGPGITPGDRDLIFHRFYRSPEARSMPGSGLGLAIVKQTVECLGGTVTADVSDDGGALLTATIPGRPAAAC